MKTDKIFRLSDIEPLCVIKMLLNNLIYIIMAAAIGFLGVSVYYSNVYETQYSCSATFAVTAKNGSSIYYNSDAASEVATTFSSIMQSSIMSEKVAEALGLESIPGTVSAGLINETNLVRVTATAGSPKDAFIIMKGIVENYSELSDTLARNYILNVVNVPRASSTPVRTVNVLRNELMAAVACALLACIVFAAHSILRDTVQNTSAAKNKIDASLIASIPHEQERRKKLFEKTVERPLLITSPNVSFGFTESIHQIAARLEHDKKQDKSVFMFTSVTESEGKSTVTANTALALSKRGNKVLLIDLDLRRPVQHSLLSEQLADGAEFGSILADSSAGVEDILKSPYLMTSKDGKLSALLSRDSYDDIAVLLSSALLKETILRAREQFDYIIIDTPPLGYFADSDETAELADATVIVIRQDTVPAPDINDAIDDLSLSRAKVTGCVLNDMKHLSAQSSIYGYGYGKAYYGYSKAYGKYSRGYGYGKTGYYGYGGENEGGDSDAEQ